MQSAHQGRPHCQPSFSVVRHRSSSLEADGAGVSDGSGGSCEEGAENGESRHDMTPAQCLVSEIVAPETACSSCGGFRAPGCLKNDQQLCHPSAVGCVSLPRGLLP